MKSVTNHKLIRRNARIGQYTSLVALVILGIGMYITFKMPEQFIYSLAALLLGFFLSQLGIYFGNRWGRRPRPDEWIDKGLKGLERDFIIYHYVTPVHHLLVSPAGIWVLMPYYQGGEITYEKGRWRQRGGGFLQSYLRLFGQEGLGRPDYEAGAAIENVKRYLGRLLPEMELPPVEAALVFTNPKAVIHVEEAPLPTLAPDDLKEFLRRRAKEKPMPSGSLATLHVALPKPSDEDE